MGASSAEQPESRAVLVGFRFFAGYFAPFSGRKIAIIVYGSLFFSFGHTNQ
jgi:hypothetical protein